MKHGYVCQFCREKSLASDWYKNTCPKCGKVYNQAFLSKEELHALIYIVDKE